MAAKSLEELKADASKLNIPLTGEETATEIKNLIKTAQTPPPPTDPLPPTPPVTEKTGDEKEVTMKVSDIKKLIAQAIIESKESAPIKPKKVTEHHVHVWRLDGKWVVDFKDRNVDEYYKGKIHSFQKFNEQKREFEAWIEVVFQDGTTKELPLYRYVQNRHLVYCQLVKRHLADQSYVIGEVEKKKEVGDKLVGTGVMVDQTVEKYETTFEVKLPDGTVLMLPEYVIA